MGEGITITKVSENHITMPYKHTTHSVAWAHQAVVSIRESSRLIPGQATWNLWWSKWQWRRFFSKNCCSPLPVSFLLIYSPCYTIITTDSVVNSLSLSPSLSIPTSTRHPSFYNIKCWVTTNRPQLLSDITFIISKSQSSSKQMLHNLHRW
jgi:hypothetical protein